MKLYGKFLLGLALQLIVFSTDPSSKVVDQSLDKDKDRQLIKPSKPVLSKKIFFSEVEKFQQFLEKLNKCETLEEMIGKIAMRYNWPRYGAYPMIPKYLSDLDKTPLAEDYKKAFMTFDQKYPSREKSKAISSVGKYLIKGAKYYISKDPRQNIDLYDPLITVALTPLSFALHFCQNNEDDDFKLMTTKDPDELYYLIKNANSMTNIFLRCNPFLDLDREVDITYKNKTILLKKANGDFVEQITKEQTEDIANKLEKSQKGVSCSQLLKALDFFDKFIDFVEPNSQTPDFKWTEHIHEKIKNIVGRIIYNGYNIGYFTQDYEIVELKDLELFQPEAPIEISSNTHTIYIISKGYYLNDNEKQNTIEKLSSSNKKTPNTSDEIKNKLTDFKKNVEERIANEKSPSSQKKSSNSAVDLMQNTIKQKSSNKISSKNPTPGSTSIPASASTTTPSPPDLSKKTTKEQQVNENPSGNLSNNFFAKIYHTIIKFFKNIYSKSIEFLRTIPFIQDIIGLIL